MGQLELVDALGHLLNISATMYHHHHHQSRFLLVVPLAHTMIEEYKSCCPNGEVFLIIFYNLLFDCVLISPAKQAIIADVQLASGLFLDVISNL